LATIEPALDESERAALLRSTHVLRDAVDALQLGGA